LAFGLFGELKFNSLALLKPCQLTASVPVKFLPSLPLQIHNVVFASPVPLWCMQYRECTGSVRLLTCPFPEHARRQPMYQVNQQLPGLRCAWRSSCVGSSNHSLEQQASRKRADYSGAGVNENNMRLVLITIGVLWMLVAPAATTASADEQDPAIQVLNGGWGSAHPADIEAVLYSAASEIWRYFRDRPPPQLIVRQSEKGPLTLFDRGPHGEYVVLLSARDRRWAQYAYQFSHELCHVLSNYDEVKDNIRPNQWFEESICEAMAAFTLERMAATWESNPPFLHWRDYAGVLGYYAERLAGEAHRRLSDDNTLSEWYAHNSEALGEDPYLREKNEVCAKALLPLFQSNPARWAAIGYLNRDTVALAGSFPWYLQSWYRAAPSEHQSFIAQVIALFAPNDGRRLDVAFLKSEQVSRESSHPRPASIVRVRFLRTTHTPGLPSSPPGPPAIC
jgi:hypothetical protein